MALGSNQDLLGYVDINQKMDELCFYRSGESIVPKLELLSHPACRRDSMGSFIGHNRAENLQAILGVEKG